MGDDDIALKAIMAGAALYVASFLDKTRHPKLDPVDVRNELTVTVQDALAYAGAESRAAGLREMYAMMGAVRPGKSLRDNALWASDVMTAAEAAAATLREKLEVR